MPIRTVGKLNKIENILREKLPLLESEFKVKDLAIFGSYVRNEQKKSSDLDILVEFSETIGLFHFVRLENFLSDLLGIKVDLVMKDSLKPRIKDRVLKEALYI
jgi:uncharacterized protein